MAERGSGKRKKGKEARWGVCFYFWQMGETTLLRLRFRKGKRRREKRLMWQGGEGRTKAKTQGRMMVKKKRSKCVSALLK